MTQQLETVRDEMQLIQQRRLNRAIADAADGARYEELAKELTALIAAGDDIEVQS